MTRLAEAPARAVDFAETFRDGENFAQTLPGSNRENAPLSSFSVRLALFALGTALPAAAHAAQDTVGALVGAKAPVPLPPVLPFPVRWTAPSPAMNGGPGGGLTLSLQLLVIMGLLTILPSLILMMTSFTRILVVLLDPAAGAGAAAVAAQPGADRPGAVPRCS
jgi:hypothetical protein